MSDVWKDVVGYEGYYQISDSGKVRGLRSNKGLRRTPRSMKTSITHDGYERVTLTMGGNPKHKTIHVMVAEAFLGNRPDGMQACHNDGNSLNNVLGNIRWGTPRSNYDDCVEHGSRKGTKHHQCTISEDVAKQIKAAASDKSRWASDIASEFDTTVHVVRNIRNGKSWNWLEA